MKTFKDFLVWYNNLDVGPFVQAVLHFQKHYFDKGIDIFKMAISLPGIARQLLFKSAKRENANFALFDKRNADLYQTVKQNIIGGPSIIFNRHHHAQRTRIRGGKLCGSIVGFDANALYLEAIGKPMPVGPFVRRKAENDFRPEVRDTYMSAYYWMDWLIRTKGVNIRHKLNHGNEVKIGKYPGEDTIMYRFVSSDDISAEVIIRLISSYLAACRTWYCYRTTDTKAFCRFKKKRQIPPKKKRHERQRISFRKRDEQRTVT